MSLDGLSLGESRMVGNAFSRPASTPGAFSSYHVERDEISYFTGTTDTYDERIDDRLTVHYARGTRRVVGVILAEASDLPIVV